MSCSAVSCSSRTTKGGVKDPDLSFYSVPIRILKTIDEVMSSEAQKQRRRKNVTDEERNEILRRIKYNDRSTCSLPMLCSTLAEEYNVFHGTIYDMYLANEKAGKKKLSTPTTNPFSSSTTFCANCGSILPLLQDFGSVKCYSCKAFYDAENFNNVKFEYTIHFNTVSTITNEKILNTDNPEGPVVERKCPKCGNDRMSYATLQLRSADEGQTVFYTCTSCKYKETENS